MKVPAICCLLVSSSFAIEPWADQKLPVKDDVLLWLDAARQPAARDARKLAPAGGPLDVWLDGSGTGHHVAQRTRDAMPVWQMATGGAFVRFDGKDDWLGANMGVDLQSASVFVVAAPRANPGVFRALISGAEFTRNDFQTGFNLDLGGRGTPTFSVLNAEGAGFGGERNLLSTQLDFGTFHVFGFISEPRAKGVRLFLDGTPQGSRDRAPSSMKIDALLIGGRLYSNSADPVAAASPFDGDIAEVLVFNRALNDDDRAKVERYLVAKHSGLKAITGATPLVPVKDPPPVQMFVPGFSVKKLPVELTNIDCLRYRADGTLVAGAYNGKIWLLRDTDGDGLEDKATLYWESADLKGVIGMTLTLPNDPRGEGVFVATQGRILFIPDKDGDGRGDEQRVIASGWEKQVAGGGGGIVDALGLTMDRDGDLYFGLGVSAYNNAYLLDAKKETSAFKLATERGTVQRVSADFSKRETVCTGIRYPVGAAFNAWGDLFMTEQEGATWLANGNAFDELVHIQPGRHYGFPPMHPKWLPGVIDEPSVFDYGPQHQSACGFVFNEVVEQASSPSNLQFGPSWWKGDALVTGESRGKLWRTKLVKTHSGYVAQNQLLAALSMLPVDAALSPRGDLLVTCHSGGPDWGTGPQGAGKIFKITYTAKNAPQPVAAWSASPTELRVAFDRELDLAKFRDLAKQTAITQGLFVSAGDRFESFRPGYQVVKDQLAEPRFDVPVLGAALSADRREILLTTAPRAAAVNYALTLPNGLDLASDLSGLDAEWTGTDGAKWKGWLPHPDLAVARKLMEPSAAHARLFALIQKAGTMTLRGQIDIWQMLHPAVQPGATLDYEPAVEKVSVVFGGWKKEGEARRGEWLPFEASFATGDFGDWPRMMWSTDADPRSRAMPLRRLLLPWAKPHAEPAKLITDREVPEIQGGNWLRGRKLYFGKAMCATCHTMRDEGGHAGPDLGNLTQRDYASVVRDIREPSAALNPDHLAYLIEPKVGDAFTAVMAGENRYADATGKIRELARSEIKSTQALPISLMPPGLLEALSQDEQRDLLTYLLIPPMEPAPIQAPNPPPPRKRAEVEALLKQIAATRDQSAIRNPQSAMQIVLCDGPKDHGPGEHDYPLWKKRWSRLLALADGVEVSTASVWPSAGQWQSADVVVFFSNNPGWNANRAPELDAFLARGKGVAFFHWAVEGHGAGDLLADRIGLASVQSMTKYRHGAVDFTLAPHPLTAGLPPLSLVDETYWSLRGDERRLQLIASAIEENAPRPQLWTREQGGGRVFVSIPGHYNWTFDDPLFRVLAFRGICWAAGQQMDRLVELSTIGARIAE